jgi:hypothetical protein
MSYAVNIYNTTFDDKQTFSVEITGGKCDPPSGTIPSAVKESDGKIVDGTISLTVDNDTATGTITFSYGPKVPLQQAMTTQDYADTPTGTAIPQTLHVNPKGGVNTGEEGNDVKITRP